MANVGNHAEVINLDSNRPFAADGFKVCFAGLSGLSGRSVQLALPARTGPWRLGSTQQGSFTRPDIVHRAALSETERRMTGQNCQKVIARCDMATVQSRRSFSIQSDIMQSLNSNLSTLSSSFIQMSAMRILLCIAAYLAISCRFDH